MKDLKCTIGGHEFNRKVSQSESLKAQKERAHQRLHDQPLSSHNQPLSSQRQVRKLLISVSRRERRGLSIRCAQTQTFKNWDAKGPELIEGEQLEGRTSAERRCS